jgi:CubicO group peptidase (beta-lactamase class C family)
MHFSNAAYIQFISALPAVAEPDSQFYYSNFAYHLLSIILEEVYETSFNTLLQTKICQPLGMTQTLNTTDNEVAIPNLAEGYVFDAESQTWKSNNFIDLTLGRRIFSTTSDLQKWGAAMHSDDLLSAEERKLLLSNYVSEIEPLASYGYGWVVYAQNTSYNMGDLGINQPYIIHGGATEGYKSMLIVINHGEWIISMLANSGNRSKEMELSRTIAQYITTHDI